MLINSVFLFSQEEQSSNENQKPEGKQTPEPLELPNFIIEGTEQLNVRSGIKQIPTEIPSLSDFELDSLNSLEKQMSVALPISELPQRVHIYDYSNGFLKASLGNYITPNIEGGWGLNYDGYELYANGGLEFSNGWVEDSDYSDVFLKVTSDYIADKKFYIFGGSRTRTKIDFSNRNYNLFAVENPDNRNLTNFLFDIESDGKFEGVDFSTGAGVSTTQLASDTNNAFDNSFQGHLTMKSLWNNFIVSGTAELDFRTIRGDAANFGEVYGEVAVFSDKLTLSGGLGFQFAVNTMEENRSGVKLFGNLEYRMSKMFTISGTINSGLVKQNFGNAINQNNFLDHSAEIDFPYEIFMLSGKLSYHPSPDFAIAVGTNFGITDRFPIYTPKSDSLAHLFSIAYEKVNVFEFLLESYWEINEKDRLSGILITNLSSPENNDLEMAYVPLYQLELNYAREWVDNLITKFGIEFVSQRENALIESNMIDGFVNLNFEASYMISKKLKAFVNADNILNNTIYVWDGYRHRDIFVSFGVRWQFD